MLTITARLPRCKRIFSLQHRDQPLDIRLLRGPAGRDAHDSYIAPLFPEAHGDVCGEAGELRLIVIVFFGFSSRKHPAFPRMDDVLTLLT